MTSTSTVTPTRPAGHARARRQLRQLLILDALICGANGLAYLLAGAPLESLLGVDADVLRPLGIFLLAYAAAVAIVAARTVIPRAATLTIIAANIVWALGSLLVLAFGSLSPTLAGGIWIAAQAVATGGLAGAQNWALRRAT